MLSYLQYSILEHCCKNQGTDYDRLCKEIGKSKTTIIQSVNSLVRYGYIEKHKVNPKREKSKITIKPTYRGMNEAWRLGVDAEDILKQVENKDVNDFIYLIKELPDVPRRYIFHQLAVNLLGSAGWIDEMDKKRLVKDSFNDGILESIKDPNFNAQELFNGKIKNWLVQMYSDEDLKKLKEELLTINCKSNSVIRELSV